MKRKNRKILAAGLSMVLIGAQALTVSADTAADLESARAAKEATTSKLSEINTQLDDLEAKKAEITGEINSLDSQLVTTIATINLYDEQIEEKEEQLEETEAELDEAKETQETQYDAMKKRIQFIYENGGQAGWATIVLEQGNISEFVDNAKNTQDMYKYDRDCLQLYAETVETVNTLRDSQLAQKASLITMRNEQEDAKGNLENLLTQAKATSADYDSQISDVNARAAEFQRVIEEQNQKIAELVAQQEAERKAAEEAARKAAEEEAARKAAEEASRAAAQAAQAQAAAVAPAAETYTEDASSQGVQAEEPAPAASQETSSPAAAPAPAPAPSGNSGMGSQIVGYAMQFVGNPYVWGGTSLTNGCDCSGFVQQVFAHFGINLSRTTYTQINEGVAVSPSDIQPGDVINYGWHTAIYTGNGIVHAADESLGIITQSNAFYQSVVGIRRYY